MRSEITTTPIDSASILREVSAPHNGATVLFEGVVREQNEGRAVTGIEYAAYRSMARRELSRIVQECCAQFDTDDVIALHRIGRLDVGEASVVIAAAHPHRAQAYEASRYIIEQIKLRLPIWKREEYADGTREWVGQGRGSGIGNRESYSTSRDAYADHALGADSRFPIPDSR
ncbi:MAG: molybdenum cofactor biosynthesis protein MoaE [Gemmatimonadaceae bacterium]